MKVSSCALRILEFCLKKRYTSYFQLSTHRNHFSFATCDSFLTVQRFNDGLAFSIDSGKQVLLIGQAKYYGRCKGLLKESGLPCNNIINT
jgi:hypothetical protein